MVQLELCDVSGKPVEWLWDAQAAPDRQPRFTKKRARSPGASLDPAGWTLEPHVCRHCFGRLMSRPASGQTRYLCTNCGAGADGPSPDVLCACGLKLRNHGPGGEPIDAGLRCQANPAPSPEFPSLFVAAEPRF